MIGAECSVSGRRWPPVWHLLVLVVAAGF